MSKQLKCTLMIAVAASTFVGGARADDDNQRECSDATLRGLYVFSAHGYNIVAGVAQPKAITEMIRFNADGTLTVPAATVSLNGTIVRSPPGTGTYTVAENCTGSLVFTPGPTFDIFVAPNGSVVYMMQTGQPGAALPVLQGAAERVSR